MLAMIKQNTKIHKKNHEQWRTVVLQGRKLNKYWDEYLFQLARKKEKCEKPSAIKDDKKLRMIKESAKHWWLEYSVTKIWHCETILIV